MIQKKQKKQQFGDAVKIRLSSQEELSCKITYIDEDEDDSRLIVFETSSYSTELINYRKISIDIIWWSDEGLKIPNSAIETDGELSYVTRNRAGYLDKILVKILRKNESYSIVGKYKTEELKELGYSQSEISNMRGIALYDEILTNTSKKKINV